MTQDVYLQQLFISKLIIIFGVIGPIVYVFLMIDLAGFTPYQVTKVLMCKVLEGYG
ncbi:hypothetical protein H0A36_25325 [Endozoicomonas sp. SM1973]|uniref:Uncharacterized protein n=1 Tax=Spartinivicinus marinus TaxID=2994442 RepID=A0A853IH38_9GAMM|nr:hypothetical protein [Spartinivicinus marinus]NYZ69344.1 hypothetical protein [Spartinivicinus marinus]